MGFLGILFKPLKKLVKKIGKGIKKVAKKIGKAVNKLGIVGQIGMMFLMPYAVGALSSFFGATGTIAGWSTKLLASKGLGATAAKALGHTLNAINTVGTMAGQVYTGVTNTIGKAWDVVAGKGTIADVGKAFKGTFTDTADALKLMDPKFIAQKHAEKAAQAALTKTTVAREFFPQKGPTGIAGGEYDPVTGTFKKRNILEDGIRNYENAQRDAIAKNVAAAEAPVGGDLIAGISGRSETIIPVSETPAWAPEYNVDPTKIGSTVSEETVQQSLLEKGKDILKKGWEDAKTDIEGKAVAKVKDVVTVKAMEVMGLEEPQQGQEAGSYSLPYAYTKTDSGIDFTNSFVVDSFAKQGNNHLAYSLANLSHVSSVFDSNNNPTTNSFMTEYYIAPNIARQIGAP